MESSRNDLDSRHCWGKSVKCELTMRASQAAVANRILKLYDWGLTARFALTNLKSHQNKYKFGLNSDQ